MSRLSLVYDATSSADTAHGDNDAARFLKNIMRHHNKELESVGLSCEIDQDGVFATMKLERKNVSAEFKLFAQTERRLMSSFNKCLVLYIQSPTGNAQTFKLHNDNFDGYMGSRTSYFHTRAKPKNFMLGELDLIVQKYNRPRALRIV